MAIKTVVISSEQDLESFWTDSRCPNLEWTFIEQEFEECLQEDGTYLATYDTLEVPEGETFSMTYLCQDTGGAKMYTLTEGEYGIKP